MSMVSCFQIVTKLGPKSYLLNEQRVFAACNDDPYRSKEHFKQFAGLPHLTSMFVISMNTENHLTD